MKLGFALQLVTVRCLGLFLEDPLDVPAVVVDFVARQPITAGQEITFDYAMRNYTVEHFAAHCQCGSPGCRDRITGWKDLPSGRKADYRGFVAPLPHRHRQPGRHRTGPVTSYGSSRGRLTRPARSSTSQAR